MSALATSLPPDLPDPPSEYDEAYVRRLVGLLNQALLALSQRRPLIGSTLNLDRLPTSATGLRSGDIWNDGGTLKIV